MPQRGPEQRWKPHVVKGFTPVSDFFLERYSSLNPAITALEAMLIIHLVSFKWDESAPYPGFPTLAKRMGLGAPAVRRHARNLEDKGYLKRIPREGDTNLFDLTPLFLKVEKERVRLEAAKAAKGRRRMA
jgi:DNA-binding MarR family transcriptional regulator